MDETKNNAAYIIKRIDEISGINPGKKVLQKMIFLMVEKGIPLNYEYGLHFYGPYSALLGTEVNYLHANDIIHLNYTDYSHEMKINGNDTVLPKGLSSEDIAAIDDVIKTFIHKSPSDLELLSTAIYAHKYLENKSKESVVEGVLKIKGKKYTREEIHRSFENFNYFNKTFSSLSL